MKKLNILYVLATVCMLSSCAPKIPFTQAIKEQNNLKHEEMKRIQFYNSADIVLQRGQRADSGKETVGGELVITSGTTLEQVVIKAGTPGVVYDVIDDNRIKVSFESGDDRYLVFGDPNNRKGPYTLLAASWDNGKGKMQYGGKEYYVSQGTANVQILFKMRRLNQFKKDQRVAKGQKVN